LAGVTATGFGAATGDGALAAARGTVLTVGTAAAGVLAGGVGGMVFEATAAGSWTRTLAAIAGAVGGIVFTTGTGVAGAFAEGVGEMVLAIAGAAGGVGLGAAGAGGGTGAAAGIAAAAGGIVLGAGGAAAGRTAAGGGVGFGPAGTAGTPDGLSSATDVSRPQAGCQPLADVDSPTWEATTMLSNPSQPGDSLACRVLPTKVRPA
jgi:hypothetical protein